MQTNAKVELHTKSIVQTEEASNAPVCCHLAPWLQNTHPFEMEEEDLQRLYTWLDEIPLSRPKRNIARDFSDGGRVYF